jgi:hypothetical protein
MANQTFDVNDLSIDPTLVGAAMRDELVIMYNKLAYWVEQHSEWDSKKKALENTLEAAKDRAKAVRAAEADEKGLKAKIQEAFIRDFWMVPILTTNLKDEPITYTCSELLKMFTEASMRETETRHMMNLCNTALDIGRTAVSWDKQEHSKMGGTQ